MFTLTDCLVLLFYCSAQLAGQAFNDTFGRYVGSKSVPEEYALSLKIGQKGFKESLQLIKQAYKLYKAGKLCFPRTNEQRTQDEAAAADKPRKRKAAAGGAARAVRGLPAAC
jgi:hypothetical protein